MNYKLFGRIGLWFINHAQLIFTTHDTGLLDTTLPL